MSDNDLSRIEALERRVDEIDARRLYFDKESRTIKGWAEVTDLVSKSSRADLLLRFFLAAMQGDWADNNGWASRRDYEEASGEYLRAARAALKVWEARNGTK